MKIKFSKLIWFIIIIISINQYYLYAKTNSNNYENILNILLNNGNVDSLLLSEFYPEKNTFFDSDRNRIISKFKKLNLKFIREDTVKLDFENFAKQDIRIFSILDSSKEKIDAQFIISKLDNGNWQFNSLNEFSINNNSESFNNFYNPYLLIDHIKFDNDSLFPILLNNFRIFYNDSNDTEVERKFLYETLERELNLLKNSPKNNLFLVNDNIFQRYSKHETKFLFNRIMEFGLMNNNKKFLKIKLVSIDCVNWLMLFINEVDDKSTE